MDATSAGEKRVAVVGAGITGLATAYLLGRARPGWHVEVFEAETHPGGKARTSVRAGYTVDWGPNGFLSTAPETLELARQLGLDAELQPASEAARHRFLYVDGGLRRLPSSPQAFLASEIVPWPGRLRAALELAVAGRHDGEESVHAFLARHFGRGFADALADAFVSGITAGDSRELSLDALFPRLRAMERAHGSLLRAMIAQQRAARRRGRAQPAPAGRLTSFREGGMQRLLDALAGALPQAPRLGAPVDSLAPEGAGGFVLTISGTPHERFDAV
ncbi:MAG: protoporphyrinogen oxidase, partial [Deinococcales bacterium]